MPPRKHFVSVDKATGSVSYFNSHGTALGKERSEDSKMLEKFEIYETLENEKLEIKETVTADGVKKKITGGDKTFPGMHTGQEFISLLTG